MLKSMLHYASVSVTLTTIDQEKGTFALSILPKDKMPLGITFTVNDSVSELDEVQRQIDDYLGAPDAIASGTNITATKTPPKVTEVAPAKAAKATKSAKSAKAKDEPVESPDTKDTQSAPQAKTEPDQNTTEPTKVKENFDDLLHDMGL